MNETIVKTLERGRHRVQILRLEKGGFIYRMQSANDEGWGALGPICGYYDSIETAEAEARERVWWLREPI